MSGTATIISNALGSDAHMVGQHRIADLAERLDTKSPDQSVAQVVTDFARGLGYSQHRSQQQAVIRAVEGASHVSTPTASTAEFTEQQVTSALGSYAQYANVVILCSLLNARTGTIGETVQAYARTIGYGSRTNEVAAVVRALEATASVGDPHADAGLTEVEGFDRQAAADVIRAFIAEGSAHLEAQEVEGFAEADVDALLILAGLEDEPEPEPEPEVEAATETVDAGLFSRLVAFARRHGFTG